MNQKLRNFKYISLIFAVLFLGFLLVSSVNATDVDYNNLTDDSTSISLNTPDESILGDNSFNDLADKVNATPENQTLTLNDDYYLDSTQSHIIIDKPMTIDGNNHAIKASGVKRVFWVKADNVCIKNINFINCNSNLPGGAISWWGNNGSLDNCNFTNNTAISGGGALLWKGDNGQVTDCRFEGNTVNYGDAVSLNDGDGFDNSKLHIMIVNCEGGAMYVSGNNVAINRCLFSNNYAYLNGGAISVNGAVNVSVSNSKFKSNSATYNGGAIDWNSQNALIINSTFENNRPETLFLNANAVIINSTFDKKSSIENWRDVTYVNVTFTDIGSFDELYSKIINTPEGGVLVLDKDYEYVNGTIKGIVISKPITIDGAGHTLNGNKLSRMFNITASDVVIRNINFKNGNALGRYGGIAGGGAIYWSGDNGFIENCNFTGNTGYGIEDDPFDKEEIITKEDGTVIYTYRFRPMGAKINEGGAIVWNGTGGAVNNCIFTDNAVGYPNYGGAICWRGDNGKVINSQFYGNDAWCGSAIVWIGDNGLVQYSIFANQSFFDGGIYWFGKNGTVKNSILIDSSSRGALRGDVSIKADYNFWGDTLENPNAVTKVKGVSNWLVMKFTHNGEFVNKGDKLVIRYDITTLTDKNGKLSSYDALINYSSQFTYTASKTGFLKITFKNGKPNVEIDSRDKIVSSNLVKYYTKKTSFRVKVYDIGGKVIGKTVKFKINKKYYYVNTNKRGVATLKIKLKPGKYKIQVSYGKAKVKNKITIKNTLVTKNLSKNVKKSAKFKVKVLNSKGKAFKNQTVKIKFKGEFYKIKTNKKGIAIFKVPRKLKVGEYKIKTMYNGLTNVNKIIVKQ